jgi:hypothetical protein
MEQRNLVLLRVSRLDPGTTYFAELSVEDGDTGEWTAIPRLEVTTSERVAFLSESRQVVIDLTAAGVDLAGTVVRIAAVGSPYPLFAVVGDVVGGGRAYADLSHLLTADGSSSATPDAPLELDVALRGFAADSITATIPYTGSARVAAATTVPFMIGAGPEVAGFAFEAIAPQTATLPFTITIRAIDAEGNTVTTFADAVTLSADPGPLQGDGSTPAFVAGVLSGYSVTVDGTGTQRLVATDAAGNRGESDPFEVAALPGPWELLVLADPSAGGTVSGSGTYVHGSLVDIEAVAAAGFRFVHWLGEGVTDPYASSTTAQMTANRVLSAVFMSAVDEENYLSWQQRYFLRNSANLEISGPDRDPNNNGFSNLLDYAFGMHPVLQGGAYRAPKVSKGPEGLTMQFHRRTNNPDLTIEVEASLDGFSSWERYVPPPADVLITPLSETGIERVDVRLPDNGLQPVFYRLRVVLQE